MSRLITKIEVVLCGKIPFRTPLVVVATKNSLKRWVETRNRINYLSLFHLGKRIEERKSHKAVTRVLGNWALPAATT